MVSPSAKEASEGIYGRVDLSALILAPVVRHRQQGGSPFLVELPQVKTSHERGGQVLPMRVVLCQEVQEAPPGKPHPKEPLLKRKDRLRLGAGRVLEDLVQQSIEVHRVIVPKGDGKILD